jgi:hypothetical protein
MTSAHAERILTPASDVDASEIATNGDVDPDDSANHNDDNYDGIDWARLPDFQRPSRQLKCQSSWIYRYSYRIQSRKPDGRIFFICGHCHRRKVIDNGGGGKFDITFATTAAAKHLGKPGLGHSVDNDGSITRKSILGQQTMIEQLQTLSRPVSQEAANAINGAWDARDFRQSFINMITDCNLPFRLVEESAFHDFIAKSNLQAEQAMWHKHQSVADHMRADYYVILLTVKLRLTQAQSRIHISFDGWTTPNNR